MDRGNIICVAFVNISKHHVLACYPATPLRGTDDMVMDGLLELYEDSAKPHANNNIKKLVLEFHTVYYHVDDCHIGAVVVMIFEDAYPQRLAYSMVQELWKEVLAVTSEEVYMNARPKSLQKSLKTQFAEIFTRYDNAEENDDALKLKVKINSAAENIENTMYQIIDTCINLEELQEKSQRLKFKANVLQDQSTSLMQRFGSRTVFIVTITVVMVTIGALYIALPIILKQMPKKNIKDK